MTLSTMVKLVWVGNRADWLRLAFTAIGAALATIVLLAAATTWWVPPTEHFTDLGGGGWSIDMSGHRYATSLLNDTNRRRLLAAVLLLLTLPALVLAGQSVRLGAPARDRRLAAIRLAGATPGQVRLVAIAEAAVASLAGAVLGVGGYFLLKRVGHRYVEVDTHARDWGLAPTNPTPHLILPTDATPPWWVFPGVTIAIPLVAALLTLVALRRVVVTPLSVARRLRIRRVRWWPLAAIGAGFGTLALHYFFNANDIGDGDITLPLTAWASVLLLVVGVALCGVPLGQLLARGVARHARRPAALLAARWILADPWGGSRSLAVALIAVLAGAASIQGLAYARAQDVGDWVTTERGLPQIGVFVLIATLAIASAGLLFAVVEGLLTRRRALASLVAAGAPASVLARAVLWQTLLPAVPAVGLAIAVGRTAVMTAQTQSLAVAPTFGPLTLLGLGAVAAIAAAAALSMPVLRTTTRYAELRTE